MTGRSTCRRLHRAEVRTRAGTVSIDLLVTASLLPYAEPPRALLILEDVTEIIRLRGSKTRRRNQTGRKRERA